jgi:BON domain
MRAGQRSARPNLRPAGRNSSREHAQWVRSHPRVDDSAFPEYPDEKPRRGSSRGALPNGNPWRPERDDEKPGPTWARPSERVSASDAPRVAADLPKRSRRVVAPPNEPANAPARVAVTSGTRAAERRIAGDVGDRLAHSKTFDGKCIEVQVHGGDVFLRGRLANLHAKVEAGLLASSVRGVSRVHNQIRLR